MVENKRLLIIIEEKILEQYQQIKMKMYYKISYIDDLNKLKLLLKLEQSEIEKIKLDYYYIDDIIDELLEDEDLLNASIDNDQFLMSFLLNKKNIKGDTLFDLSYSDKEKFINTRIFQKLILYQTKCLNYKFYDLEDYINLGLLNEYNGEYVIDDVESVTGIYTDLDLNYLTIDEYVKQALNGKHVLTFDNGLKTRFYKEVLADYYSKLCLDMLKQKENLRNFCIENILNYVYTCPILEERLIDVNFDFNKLEECLSIKKYKNPNNLYFLKMQFNRLKFNNCIKYLDMLIYYDNYNIVNYLKLEQNSILSKDIYNNITLEYINILNIISNIKVSLVNELKEYILAFEIENKRKGENDKIFKLLKNHLNS